MSEQQNQSEPGRNNQPIARNRRARSSEGMRAVDRLDDAQEIAHHATRGAPARRATFPKDDRRSSELLTERERSERWPLG
jgi:hypothetical protein